MSDSPTIRDELVEAAEEQDIGRLLGMVIGLFLMSDNPEVKEFGEGLDRYIQLEFGKLCNRRAN